MLGVIACFLDFRSQLDSALLLDGSLLAILASKSPSTSFAPSQFPSSILLVSSIYLIFWVVFTPHSFGRRPPHFILPKNPPVRHPPWPWRCEPRMVRNEPLIIVDRSRELPVGLGAVDSAPLVSLRKDAFWRAPKWPWAWSNHQ